MTALTPEQLRVLADDVQHTVDNGYEFAPENVVAALRAVADEVDRLRIRNAGLEKLAEEQADRWRESADEVDRLRAELTQSQQDVTNAENDGIGWMERANRLRAVIENAPHERFCFFKFKQRGCICWKADAL